PTCSHGMATSPSSARLSLCSNNSGPPRLRKQMRARGVRGIPRGSRTSTRLDPHGLTKREAEILQLLAAGLRNSAIAQRLFLSTKTVDHHVSSILTKLGVPSRAEAAAMARKLSE